MPQDLGRMVGNPAFEIARGVLMEVFGYTAAEALTAIGEVAEGAGLTPEAVVVHLLDDQTHAGVAELMKHQQTPPPV